MAEAFADDFGVDALLQQDRGVGVAARNITGEVLEQQQFWHALPDGWESMDYDQFLHERRRAMAQVTQEAFRRLSDPHYKPMSRPPLQSRRTKTHPRPPP